MLVPKRLATVLAFGWLGLVACRRSTELGVKDNAPSLLGLGAAIPNLNGIDQNGNAQRLEPSGTPQLVYFYPKDGTPGCTKEACAFRDVWKRFEVQKVRLFGVSADSRSSHEKFTSEHKLPFTLIADTDGKWAKAFGVPINNGKFARVSFLFDKTGHLARVYRNVDPGVHATDVLNDVTALP